MSISEELSHDTTFGNDAAIVGNCGDETAGVDGEVGRRAGDVEINYLFGVGEGKFAEDDVHAVGPGAGVVCVEDYFRGCVVCVGAHFDCICVNFGVKARDAERLSGS